MGGFDNPLETMLFATRTCKGKAKWKDLQKKGKVS